MREEYDTNAIFCWGKNREEKKGLSMSAIEGVLTFLTGLYIEIAWGRWESDLAPKIG